MNIIWSKKAYQLAVYKHDPGVELGSMEENPACGQSGTWTRDFKSDAL